jgi:hypothetical protein
MRCGFTQCVEALSEPTAMAEHLLSASVPLPVSVAFSLLVYLRKLYFDLSPLPISHEGPESDTGSL